MFDDGAVEQNQRLGLGVWGVAEVEDRRRPIVPSAASRDVWPKDDDRKKQQDGELIVFRG